MEAAVLTTLINNLVPRLLSLWDKNNKKYEAFQEDANFLGRELPMITTAIQEWQLSGKDDPLLLLLVEELRQIAHAIEDCIDHITYLDSFKEQPLLSRIGNKSITKKLPSFKELGKKMGRLKKQLEDAHQRRGRYDVSRPAPTEPPPSSSEYYVRPEDLVGLEVPLKELKKQLLEQEELKQLKVITILGFCGSGKTVLAQELFKSEVGTKFDSNESTTSKIQAWVKAEHKHWTKLLAEMQEELQLTMDQKDHFNNNRYFVVIDDMQSTEQWDAITKFRQDINTTIVVTTKIQGVARLCSAPNWYVYNMGKLSDDHSKELLRKAADLNKYSDSSLSDSRAILKMCDGQPLAVSSVGKFMQTRSSKGGPDWESICNQVRCCLGSDGSLGRVHQALMHEYTSLPNYAIKACLLYFAMFPSDHPVKPQRIMRQWLAEGFVEPENSWRGDTAEIYFEELLDRSIVHPIKESNKVKTCRTYGMMHEYVMLKSLSENHIMLCDNGNYQNTENNGNFQTKQHRCLSLQYSSTTDSSSLDIDLSLVRNLIVFGEAEPVLDFDRYLLLRVLDLEECTDLQNHHVKKVCNLLLLKYLSLGGGKHVTSLPKKIENLKLLETLDLRRTEINVLPKEVFQLPHLTHLFGKFKLPDKAMPSEQCKLQMVKGFLVDERVGYDTFLARMKKLQNVKMLCGSSATISSLTSLQKAIKEFIRDEQDAKKDHRSLSVQFDECSEDILKGLEGQCYLRSLKLNGKLEELPGFVTRLRGLKELCLKSTKLTAALLTALGTLEYLTYLKLKADELDVDDDFVLQHNALPSLVCIRFDLRSPTLPTMADGAMPNLISLQLLCEGPNGLSRLQINNFRHLREVILDVRVGVNNATIQNWQDAAANHLNRPKVILLNAPDPTEGASIQGSAESWANTNGAETHMLPNGLNSSLTESSIASSSNITEKS